MRDVDAIVVGGGVMGTSAARWLTARGRETLLLERFEIGHPLGSSAGPTRIFRLAHDDPDDVRMARLALEEWRALEDEAGEALLVPTGGLFVGAFAATWGQALAAAGETAETLTADAVRERWPSVRIPDDVGILHQADGGVAMAERTVRAQARVAAEQGAEVREHAWVERIDATGVGVEVHTADVSVRAPVAVVAAGPWAGPLLDRIGLPVQLTPQLEQVRHVRVDADRTLPTLIDRAVDPGYYAVADPQDPGRIKIGAELDGAAVDPERQPIAPVPEADEEILAFAGSRFAGARAEGAAETCVSTSTPDERFVLDRRGPVVICSPCNGVGFKFAPLIGRIVADLAMARPAPIPIERFLVSRFGL
jgi:sarcosine oxidase